MDGRTFYNLLRMNWQRGHAPAVEPWQIEDYRQIPLEKLFERLKAFGIPLDRARFISLAENSESPETLTKAVFKDANLNPSALAQVGLIVFELWRRLMHEKVSLSIFCDELDYQINLYDEGKSDSRQLQDILANLAVILDENSDQGVSPEDVFASINAACATDLEDFIYDFINDQIEAKNDPYATELLDNFAPYIDRHWHDLLSAKLIINSDPSRGNRLIAQLLQDTTFTPDLEFNLELLGALVNSGDRALFKEIVKKTVPLLVYEEDFQDLVAICTDYFHFLDQEAQEDRMHQILKKRSKNNPEAYFAQDSSDLTTLLNQF